MKSLYIFSVSGFLATESAVTCMETRHRFRFKFNQALTLWHATLNVFSNLERHYYGTTEFLSILKKLNKTENSQSSSTVVKNFCVI